MQDFISATEASSFTGVSPQTLHRFAEAGYLKIETDSDGLPLFSKNELIDVFGLDSFIGNEGEGQESEGLEVIEGTLHGGKFVHDEIVATAIDQSANKAPSGKSVEAALQSAGIVSLSKEHEVTDTAGNSSTLQELEREVSRLKALSTLQDRLLESREAEIRDLKGEREWLKGRIEKLEEKSDRDQLLLLSETQVVRKLVTMQHERKSIMRQALDWLGVTAPINTPQQTIELKPQATGASPTQAAV